MIEIEKKKEDRLKFLFKIYELSDGDENKFLNMFEVGDELGFNRETTKKITSYLKGEGLIEYIAINGIIGITHDGIRYCEDNQKNDFNKDLYNLLLLYQELIKLLNMYFRGDIIIYSEEANMNYLRLCNKIEIILIKPGFEQLLDNNWKPLDNLISLDPDYPEGVWELGGQQICGDYLSLIQNLFIEHGSKESQLNNEDMIFLSSIENFLIEFSKDKNDADQRFKEQIKNIQKGKDKINISLLNLDFDFIQNDAVKEILQYDLEEAKNTYQNKLNKSTIILCGSILEALLIDVLSRVENNAKSKFLKRYSIKPPDIENWNFYQLIDIAKEECIISPDVKKISDIMRDYRNLIHIYVQSKKGLNVDSNIANVVVNLLNITYKDIIKWLDINN